MDIVKKYFQPAAAAALLFFLTLFTPLLTATSTAAPSSGAKDRDLGEMMSQLEVAYTEVIKSIMISPVQDEDDVSFDQAGQWAEEIVKVTGLMPELSEFKEDASARAFFRQLGEEARSIQSLAKSERWEGMPAALLRLQATCIKCHIKHRN